MVVDTLKMHNHFPPVFALVLYRRRCPSSKVESKCPLMAEPELPSGGLFSVDCGSEFEEDLSVGFVINPRKAFSS